MDDGLAERLFVAFWGGDERAAALYRELGPSRRAAWERVAVAARKEFAGKVDAEVEMLRGANDAWQRAHAEFEAQLAEVRRG